MKVDILSKAKEKLLAHVPEKVQRRFSSKDILPQDISEHNPFVAIGDLYEVASKFDPKLRKKDVKKLQAELFRTEQRFAPVGSTFFYTDAESLNGRLEALSDRETERVNKRVGVVQMDRYIGSESANPNFFRLDISRGADNNLITRPGANLKPEEQLNNLSRWVGKGGYQELAFVDDVLAFGDTLPKLIAVIKATNPNLSVKVIVGLAASGGVWRGLERVQELDIPVEYLTRINASPEVEGVTKGMAIPVSRDFTILGGKIGLSDDGNQLCYPYFLPFSKPMVSVTRPDNKFESSEAYIDFSSKFIAFVEKRMGRPLVIQDLVDKGIGIPYSSMKCLQGVMKMPSPNMKVTDYLSYARKIMDENREAIKAEVEEK